MSVTHKLVASVSSDAGGSLTGTETELGSTEITIDLTVSASATNQLYTIAFTVANVQSLLLISSTGMTIKTNSSSSPGNTITLKPGIPLVWGVSAGYFANPFTVNVTSFYLTTTTASRLQGKILTS